MIKKFSSEIILVNSITLIFLVLFFIFFNTNNKDIVFVNNKKLFNEFKMTKDLSKKGDEEIKYGKKELDSLYVVVDNVKNVSEKNLTVKRIIDLKQQLEVYQENYNQDSSKKIWKRITDYSKIFSAEKKYEMIIGSQHYGNIVFGNETRDVTTELIEFINKRYEGFN